MPLSLTLTHPFFGPSLGVKTEVLNTDPATVILIVAAVALALIPSPFSILTQRRLKTEIKLHEQLHTKMEIDAKGIELLKLENLSIKRKNDNLKG